MKKVIQIIILIGILVLSSIFYFVFQKDQSKTAEIFQGDTMSDKNILEEIAENPPQLQNTKINEFGNATTSSMSIKSGAFIKIDPLHYGSGNLKVEKTGENYKLVFADNFSSAPGPDLYVYLSSPQNYKNIALGGIDTSKTLNIGKLKSTKGTQEYLISKKDFELYSDSVIIWCKSFNVQFSRADLN